MTQDKMNWAMPVMRAGYAGRGVTYVAVTGLSLWTIWQGGQAKGTSEALKTMENSSYGLVALSAIGLGLVCYCIWRVLDAITDLEDEGDDAKGMLARAGMAITGILHGIIGIGALIIAFGPGGDGGGSTIVDATAAVMAAPFGIWLVGLAGIGTIGAGIYYLIKSYRQAYLSKLRANHFTRNWHHVLRIGVAAQSLVVMIIGVFLTYAAITANPSQAVGLSQTFDWLSGQIYGQILVTVLCFGLLAFALFLFVNAVYRIIPRLADPSVPRLSAAL